MGETGSSDSEPAPVNESFSSSLTITKDDSGFSFLRLPPVSPCSDLPETADGFSSLVKRLLWGGSSLAPGPAVPERLYYVDIVDHLYEEAIERLSGQKHLGLAMEGQVLGRNGRASLLVLATITDVFLFDLLKMGEGAFKYGLSWILSAPSICKVVHDCRQVSDLLLHQHNTRLTNIFDTLAGHLTFKDWACLPLRRVRESTALSSLVSTYLGVPQSQVFTYRSRPYYMKRDGVTWLTRPLPRPLFLAAARNCLYLLALKKILQAGLEIPMRRATSAMLSSAINCTEEESRQARLQPQHLPDMRDVIPLWKRK